MYYVTQPHKCNKCQWNRTISVLQVHHKNRNRAHNTIDNLEILCPTCHYEEHYYAGDGLYKKHKKSNKIK